MARPELRPPCMPRLRATRVEYSHRCFCAASTSKALRFTSHTSSMLRMTLGLKLHISGWCGSDTKNRGCLLGRTAPAPSALVFDCALANAALVLGENPPAVIKDKLVAAHSRGALACPTALSPSPSGTLG